MPKPSKLTAAQIAAMSGAATNVRNRFRTGDPSVGGTVAHATAKALRALGLFDHEATSGWRPMAIGVWHQYRATARGREIIAIGRMLAPLAIELQRTIEAETSIREVGRTTLDATEARHGR